jgi:tRNA uridine 5-carbamoylmethylation protein Kti12
MILIMSTNLIVYGVSQKRLLKIVFASIVIKSLDSAVVSAQKTNTAAWVKSTNYFKGFRSRLPGALIPC